ncbi:hypothetical protein FRACYDRAFT_257546 [Fragilariopsis cylindrus CCMP1102]|uniref:Uncharacterized protein n=1 Tax=Fragilariopsis cylindrus CCMP1102 TaxID=635003 RepID=A0A1E7EJ18_9STRA|nr:hypothetical protein FRACYDRAFT_257546 [Fragilariopsis cylindrus CCMP1102]|eukprot:OEU05898.1 hypothetical protein FRACYDRAFT_257546 [Fragilariopsis cylindrus CCMP1102]
MIRRAPTRPPPPMSRDIFSLGACVRVDPSTTTRKVDVNYIENSIGIINSPPFITETRLHPQSFDLLGCGGVGTTRSGGRCRIEFEHEYNPQKLLPDDIYELLVQEGSVNHADYEYFTGGIDDEFDQIWEEDERFQAWYWELD